MTLNPDTLNQTPPSGTPPATPPATPPGQQSGASGQSGAQTPTSPPATAPGQQSGASEVTTVLTKDQLEERVAQAKRSGVREIFEALGFTGLDDPAKLTLAQTELADLLTFAREQKRAQLTAEQRVQADLTTAQQNALDEKTKRESAEKERDTAQQQLRDYLLRSTITAAAAGAVHPSDVYDLYAKVYMKDQLAGVIKAGVPLFAEDGTFDPNAINQDAVKAIIDKCHEERKEWWQNTIQRMLGSPSNAGATPPAGDVTKLEKQRELARAALKTI